MSRYAVSITGIDGDETLTDYEDQIKCSSIRHGIDCPVIATGTDRTDGASMHGSVVLEHALDKASPALRLACAANTNIADVVITRLTGANNLKSDVITLKTCKIVEVYLDTPLDDATGAPEVPAEFFAIDYEEIKWKRIKYVDGIQTDTMSGEYDTATMSTTTSIPAD